MCKINVQAYTIHEARTPLLTVALTLTLLSRGDLVYEPLCREWPRIFVVYDEARTHLCGLLHLHHHHRRLGAAATNHDVIVVAGHLLLLLHRIRVLAAVTAVAVVVGVVRA